MAKEKKFITCDGNTAASHIAYMFSEVAAIYPITPSSDMAENVDNWSAAGRKNIFGETVDVIEMQSEAGAAGTVHGSLQGGALTSTYTASQGLLLMIPNMYKMAGELLPAVFHVSARSLAAQALSIFGDHSDVMSARQTGFAMLASSSVQENMDLAGVAHLTAIKGRVPFMHFFDGFRTSHEIQKIEVMDQEDLKPLIDQKGLQAFRDGALSPNHPVTRGLAQNPDVYFQAREAANKYYDAIPDMVEEYMGEITKITGREYKPFMYYGADDAENIIIAIGSVTQTIREVVDSLNAKGEKVGVIVVHLYRPFSAKHFMSVMPDSVKRIAVLDRTKEPGANGEPLYLDVKDLFYGKENAPIIVGGRYGLSSKDTTPAMIISVFDNLKMAEPKNRFTLGIVDDVTFTSLPLLPEVAMESEGRFEAKFYGLGSDGTVGANKNSIKIIGDSTDKYCQAYFAYDSKKSGGFTASHLRFGDKKIMSPYLVNTPDFVACHVPAYLEKYDMVKGLKKGGTFLLNAIWDKDEVKNHLPDSVKKYLAENEINLYMINATKLAEDIGLGNRTNTIMQAAFFKIAEVIPYDKAVEQMKKMIVKSFSSKGEDVVNMNYAAVDAGSDVIKIDVPAEWASIEVKADAKKRTNVPEFVANVVDPINNLAGDSLPVSAFNGREDGTFPAGTSQYEKRGIAVNVPEWQSESCIQCNQCSYVCPHAAIRPFLLDEKEQAAAPADTTVLKANGKGYEGLGFRMQVSTLDCTGCGNCVDVCPSKTKSLVMKPLASQEIEIPRWDYMANNVTIKTITDPKQNVKSSQFAQPLFEFSGACAGCGETPYIKTITQLYGENMMVANATGCSSIYGGSCPSTPYTAGKNGKGVAWANSLFEDNAEFGLGMALSAKKLQARVARLAEENKAEFSADTNAALAEWNEVKAADVAVSSAAADKAIAALEKESAPVAKEMLAIKDWMPKRSNWIFGGDGWAYDIGYGGLDHVLASGENVNVLVMDTEIYSNTGGQSSKATPVGAVAKFAASGKRIRKKDLGMMAMSYGYVYVAQVSMGANQAQYFKALKEAEAYDGPSLIIAYAPCISHGIKGGMGGSQNEMKKAVECGYWHMYRHNPALEAEGKNPFVLDSKEPNWDNFQDFLKGEVRYTTLLKSFPEEATELFEAAQENAKWRYKSYKRMAAMDYSSEE